MKTPTTIVLLIAILMLLTACGPKSKPMYYFGDSSSTLYAYKKAPSDESFVQMKKSIQEVIEHSEQNGIAIAPGTFANIGYINLMEGNPDQAIAYFNKEKQLYPEATVFMDRMIQKVEAQSGEDEYATTTKGEADAQK